MTQFLDVGILLSPYFSTLFISIPIILPLYYNIVVECFSNSYKFNIVLFKFSSCLMSRIVTSIREESSLSFTWNEMMNPKLILYQNVMQEQLHCPTEEQTFHVKYTRCLFCGFFDTSKSAISVE